MGVHEPMAILDILLEGDRRLRQKSVKIRAVDDSLRRLAADMHETMDAAPGVGLAAPQVGVLRRLAVVHVPGSYQGEGEPDVVMTLVNPEIVRAQGHEVATEGCLSIPGWVGDVPRSEAITVKAMDLDNRPVRIKARGFLARAIQHEIDHLDGVLFVDRVEDRSTLREVIAEDDAAEVAVQGGPSARELAGRARG